MNIVIRSLDAGKSSIPPTANISSGYTSVCSRPLTNAWRSLSLPGIAAAWPENAESPPSSERSANRNVPAIASNRISPQTKAVGPSMATVPPRASRPYAVVSPTALRSIAIQTVAASAATRPPRVRTSWAVKRRARGKKASTSTPAHATPKTISMGSSWAYSMVGLTKVMTRHPSLRARHR
jgi:hypothetical protein